MEDFEQFGWYCNRGHTTDNVVKDLLKQMVLRWETEELGEVSWLGERDSQLYETLWNNYSNK